MSQDAEGGATSASTGRAPSVGGMVQRLGGGRERDGVDWRDGKREAELLNKIDRLEAEVC